MSTYSWLSVLRSVCPEGCDYPQLQVTSVVQGTRLRRDSFWILLKRKCCWQTYQNTVALSVPASLSLPIPSSPYSVPRSRSTSFSFQSQLHLQCCDPHTHLQPASVFCRSAAVLGMLCGSSCLASLVFILICQLISKHLYGFNGWNSQLRGLKSFIENCKKKIFFNNA